MLLTAVPAFATPAGVSENTNADLIGTWGGALSGTSRFYEFKLDGTYICRVYRGNTGVTIALNILTKGIWRESSGTVYLTQNLSATWSHGSKIPDNLEWKASDDESIQIRMKVDDNPVSMKYGNRYIEVLDIFVETPGFSKPIAYLRLYNPVTQDWALPR